MTIFTKTYFPYEYKNKCEALIYILHLSSYMKKSIHLVEKDNEHLTIRCPLSGDYLDITGTPEELEWLDNELNQGWYRTKSS